VIDNISYLIGDARMRAADAPRRRTVRARRAVDVLAAPAAAPWMRILRGRRLLRAVAPARAVPIHQAIINPNARGIYYGRLTEMTNTDFQVLTEETGTEF